MDIIQWESPVPPIIIIKSLYTEQCSWMGSNIEFSKGMR